METAKGYKYVVAVVYGIVREVYEVDEWYQYNEDRIAFNGKPTNAPISSLNNKRIPKKYREKGLLILSYIKNKKED